MAQFAGATARKSMDSWHDFKHLFALCRNDPSVPSSFLKCPTLIFVKYKIRLRETRSISFLQNDLLYNVKKGVNLY